MYLVSRKMMLQVEEEKEMVVGCGGGGGRCVEKATFVSLHLFYIRADNLPSLVMW
jgi:hypothetical protein